MNACDFSKKSSLKCECMRVFANPLKCECMRVYGGACILHHMWVHAYLQCTVYKEHRALDAFDDIARALVRLIIHVYTNAFAHVCSQTFARAGTCGYDLVEFFIVGVHACFITCGCMRASIVQCWIYKDCWALIRFSVTGLPGCHCMQ